jgi:hypothetical protein
VEPGATGEDAAVAMAGVVVEETAVADVAVVG